MGNRHRVYKVLDPRAPHLQRMLPGVLPAAQLRLLFHATDADGSGRVTLAELGAFVVTRRRRQET